MASPDCFRRRAARDAKQWRVRPLSGHEQHRGRGVRIVALERLEHQRRTGLAEAALPCRGGEAAALHACQAAASASKPARRVSGTQIYTGRKPGARNASRWRCTRCAVRCFIRPPLHVTMPCVSRRRPSSHSARCRPRRSTGASAPSELPTTPDGPGDERRHGQTLLHRRRRPHAPASPSMRRRAQQRGDVVGRHLGRHADDQRLPAQPGDGSCPRLRLPDDRPRRTGLGTPG